MFCTVRQQKKFQLNPESYNGAARDNYSWSQSITDVDVHVMVGFTFSHNKSVRNLITMVDRNHSESTYLCDTVGNKANYSYSVAY